MSGTHANPLGLKTDAPPEVMWDIMRCWVAEHPSKKPLDPDSYEGKPPSYWQAAGVLFKIAFDDHFGRELCSVIIML